MSRIKAFLLHFTGSALVLSIFFALVLLVWYPPPYFETEGGRPIVLILLGVDLVLGPLLTLILFRPGKKGLLFDMTVIFTVQIAAFLYGAHTLVSERPLYVVHGIDRFNVVPASNVDTARLRRPGLAPRWFSGPLFVVARPPEDPVERGRVTLAVVNGEPDIERRPEYYVPYDEGIDAVLARLRPVELLLDDRGRPQNRDRVTAALAGSGVGLDAVGYLPLAGKNRDMALLVSRRDGQIVGVVDTYPWVKPPK